MTYTVSSGTAQTVDVVQTSVRFFIDRPLLAGAAGLIFRAKRQQITRISGAGPVVGSAVNVPDLTFVLADMSPGANKTAVINGLQAMEATFDALAAGNPI